MCPSIPLNLPSSLPSKTLIDSQMIPESSASFGQQQVAIQGYHIAQVCNARMLHSFHNLNDTPSTVSLEPSPILVWVRQSMAGSSRNSIDGHGCNCLAANIPFVTSLPSRVSLSCAMSQSIQSWHNESISLLSNIPRLDML